MNCPKRWWPRQLVADSHGQPLPQAMIDTEKEKNMAVLAKEYGQCLDNVQSLNVL